MNKKVCLVTLLFLQCSAFAEQNSPLTNESHYKNMAFDENSPCNFMNVTPIGAHLLPKGTVVLKTKRGKHGDRGRKGRRGKQGSTGTQGPQGPQGPQGIQGPIGPIGPVGTANFIAPHNLFVDAATTQNPLTADGTLAHPYNTITAAVNSIPTPTSATQFALGTTIYVAGGVYNEDLNINGDSKRITIVALGNVTLGTGATNTVNITYTAANGTFGASIRTSVTFESLTAVDRGAIPGTAIAAPSVPAFRFLGAINVLNNSSTFFRPDLLINADISTITLAPASTEGLQVYTYNTVVRNALILPADTVFDFVSNDTVFLGLVTTTFVSANHCIFDAGLTLNSSLVPPMIGSGTQIGYVNCQINGILNGNNFPFWVDSFTNSWIKGTDGAGTSTTIPTPVTTNIGGMKIIGRTIP